GYRHKVVSLGPSGAQVPRLPTQRAEERDVVGWVIDGEDSHLHAHLGMRSAQCLLGGRGTRLRIDLGKKEHPVKGSCVEERENRSGLFLLADEPERIGIMESGEG